jgi:hypothetical protein
MECFPVSWTRYHNLTLRTVISNQTPRLIASPGGNAIGVDSFEGCSLGAVREKSGQAPPATMKLVAKCCISLDHAIGTEDTQERRKVRPTLQKNASSAPESRKMTLRRQVNAKTGKRSRRCVFEVRITVFCGENLAITLPAGPASSVELTRWMKQWG